MVGFLDTLGAMFSGIAGGPDGVHSQIWNELKPWIMNLGPAASRKWIPRVASREQCEVPVITRGHHRGECENLGLAICVVCRRPCCLQHAHVDQNADAICYLCVADAVQVVPPIQRERARQANAGAPPPPPGSRKRERPPPGNEPPPAAKPGPSQQMIDDALRTLGLTRGAKWAAIKSAHRKLSGINHPDKMHSARAKSVADARFKEIQKAFEVLKQVHPEA